jgi:uncharacterized protein YqfA (UPF0365 family)
MQGTGFIIAAIVAVVVLAVMLLAFLLRHLGIWFPAYTSAVPLSFSEVIKMQFRKTDVTTVVRALIMAKQGLDLDLSPAEVERAYLQGADVDKVIRTLIAVKRAKGSLCRSVEIAHSGSRPRGLR